MNYHFFAPAGRFDACGMFTTSHILSVIICLVLIALASAFVIKSDCVSSRQKMMKCTAIILTILEIIKISHSFYYGDLYLDAWFPLSYCGLFIFAAWISGFGNGRIRHIADAYITYGCPVAGICFLIFPTTSLMSYPVWHYFSAYSLLFHTLMIFFGIISLHQEQRLTISTYLRYLIFILPFSVISIIINHCEGSNLMNLREPYNIPIAWLQTIYDNASWLYTALTLFLYISIPLIVGGVCRKISPCKSQ